MIYKVYKEDGTVIFSGTEGDIRAKFGSRTDLIKQCAKDHKEFKKGLYVREENYNDEVDSVQFHLEKYGNTIVHKEPERMLKELKKRGLKPSFHEDTLVYESEIPQAVNGGSRFKKHKIYLFEL